MDTAGLTPFAMIDGMYSRDTAAQVTRDLCGGDIRPDAIFVGNDHMAFAVMDTLRFELGLKVPADVSVIGYDDVPLSGWPAYDLTTIRQPVNRMVEATVEALLTQIDAPATPPCKLRIDGPLVVRTSARRPVSGPHHDGPGLA